MGLSIWFPEDGARILGSVDQTMVATQAAIPALDPEKAEAYQQGFHDAIRAVAVAFGVTMPVMPAGNGSRPTASTVDAQRLPGEQRWSMTEQPGPG